MSETAENRINNIETTDERLTGREGLTFFVRYLTDIGIRLVPTLLRGNERYSEKEMGKAHSGGKLYLKGKKKSKNFFIK